jgi:hypothetical protein
MNRLDEHHMHFGLFLFVDRAAMRKTNLRSLICPAITYYWTVPLILDHSYLVWILTSSKIADTKVSGF